MFKDFYKLLAISTMTLIGTIDATAADKFTFTDGKVVLGQVYDLPSFCSAEGTFVAPSTGVLIQDGCPDLHVEGATQSSGSALPSYGEYGQMWSWNVEKGVTYTIGSSFVMNGGKVVFAMADEFAPKIISISPEEGATVTPVVNLTGDITIRFNCEISYESVTFVVGDMDIVLSPIQPSTNSISVNIATVMRSLYENGTISKEGGDKMQIVYKGLKNSAQVVYGEDGTLVLNYVTGPNPVNLISSNLSDGLKLKSYYPVGDPEGIFTFVFDGDLANDGQSFVELTAGDVEADYYYENLPVKIEGATVTADFTGKLRDLSGIIKNGEFIGCKLVNIRDSKGIISSGSGNGNVGSYSYTLVYDYIQPANITSEFTPASGKSLVGVENINIWFNNRNKIAYEGVVFRYDDNGKTEEIVILTEDLTVVEESANDIEYTVKVPEVVKGKPTVVTLYNMVSYDGYDHSEQVMAYYDQFLVTLTSPIKGGQKLKSTGTSDFEIKVNAAYPYMRYDFYSIVTEAHPDGWVGGGVFTQKGNYYTAPNGDYACYADFTPYMVVSAYASENEYLTFQDPIGTFTFTFIGTTGTFEYSPNTLVNITPAEGSLIEAPFDTFCFTLQFDGLVTIELAASGMSEGLDSVLAPLAKAEAAASAGDPEGFANKWLLYPNIDFLLNHASGILIVKAYDSDGAILEGNHGELDDSVFAFNYLIKNPTDAIDNVGIDISDSYEVYNLQGVHILSTTNRDQVTSLPAGLYIINGRKAMIK